MDTGCCLLQKRYTWHSTRPFGWIICHCLFNFNCRLGLISWLVSWLHFPVSWMVSLANSYAFKLLVAGDTSHRAWSGDSSGRRAYDWKARRNTEVGSSDRCSIKGPFSQSQLPVLTVSRYPYSRRMQSHASTSVPTLNIPNTGSYIYNCLDMRKHCTHWEGCVALLLRLLC